MKLFILSNMQKFHHDQTQEILVRAKDEEQARLIASAEVLECERDAVFLKSKWDCKRLIVNGMPTSLMIDFCEG